MIGLKSILSCLVGARLILCRWDSNTNMELLKDKRLKYINNNVTKILSLLEKKKENKLCWRIFCLLL